MSSALARVRRRAVDRSKRGLRGVFEVGQRLGVNITPRHFYSQIPDVRALRASDGWRAPYSMCGVRGFEVADQLAWLRETCPSEITTELGRRDLYAGAAEANGAVGYGPVETEVLYALVRTRRPAKVLQVGAGASTWVIQEAARDAGVPVAITAVDPFPTTFLTAAAGTGGITLRDVPVQSLDPDELAAELGAGDVLFIDSTHTVTPGSDVNYVILELLPRLAEGVLVHFHDITMPFDFGPGLLSEDLFFWSENVLLHAFLAGNPRFVVRYGGAFLHDRARADAQQVLPAYSTPLETDRGLAVDGASGQFPSSMWLEVVAPPAAP